MRRKMETIRDLMEEAKRRSVLLTMCVLGLAYLMSLTSSSVWMNIPAAIAMIVVLRCLSKELEAQKKKHPAVNIQSQHHYQHYQQLSPSDPLLRSPPIVGDWKKKVDSPVVEAALDSFTQHVVREWLTDLWYSSITPDKDAPEELRELINDIVGEIAKRARHVNLIDMFTRDMVDLIRSHLELYRRTQANVGEVPSILTLEERDLKLKLALISSKELHPAVFSSEAENKVLEQLMGGLLAIILRPEDLHCKLFRFISRELLACAVMRPIMKFASPRFINDLILKSFKKETKAHMSTDAKVSETKNGKILKSLPDQFSGAQDISQSGVELVQLRPSVPGASPTTNSVSKIENNTGKMIKSGYMQTQKVSQTGNKVEVEIVHGRESLIPVKTARDLTETATFHGTTGNDCRAMGQPDEAALPEKHSIQDGSSVSQRVPEKHSIQDGSTVTQRVAGNDWGQMLEVLSKRKTQALAPEHLENMWTKGRNYKKREGTNSLVKEALCMPVPLPQSSTTPLSTSYSKKQDARDMVHRDEINKSTAYRSEVDVGNYLQKDQSHVDNECGTLLAGPEDGDGGESSSAFEDDGSDVEGLGTPGVKVWETLSSRKASASEIRHPLESSGSPKKNRKSKTQLRLRKPVRFASDRQHSKNNGYGLASWQEVERTTFSQGDSLDILKNVEKKPSECIVSTPEELSHHTFRSSTERLEASSSISSSASNMHASSLSGNHISNSSLPFFSQKLGCHVLGANFVKSGTKILAVYSIAVTDFEDHTWFVKRRFRHFEELHKRLKEYPEYGVNLPPKNFLSSSLDSSFVLKRCILLDKYLQDLLSIPAIAESVEVWDFLSADSQTYVFGNPLTVIKALTAGVDHEKDKMASEVSGSLERREEFSMVSCTDNQEKDGSESVTLSPAVKLSASGLMFAHNEGRSPQGSAMDISNDEERFVQGDYGDYRVAKTDRNLSDTDSDMEEERLGLWSREIEESGDQHVTRKMKYLEKAVASLSEGCLPGSSTGVVEDDLAVPLEWIPPKLSMPLLNLVDVIFELEARGWIRRQVFWMAKQVLQLGMGDAFDDWILAKIQYLRRGEVIARGIEWVEQTLWPDGIFITKHRRLQLSGLHKSGSLPQGQAHGMRNKDSQHGVSHQLQSPSEQSLDVSECAKQVRDIVVENAPSALVSLIGRKEYHRCAQDIYLFLQSTVFVKQLAYSILETILLATFPELHNLVLDIRSTTL